MLPMPHRLRHSADFGRVHRNGRRVSTEAFVLTARRTGNSPSRFGFSASKKLGGAVLRNRARRRLREAVRPLLSQTGLGWDVAISARQGSLGMDGSELRSCVHHALVQMGVVRKDGTVSGECEASSSA